jgi:hypothetical protein
MTPRLKNKLHMFMFFVDYMCLKLQIREHQVLEEHQKQAYKKIITLVPNMVSTITKLCQTRNNDEGLHDSMLFKFIELVSNASILSCSLFYLGNHQLHDASNQAWITDTAKVNKAICELMVKDIGGHLSLPMPNEKCMRGWQHVDTGQFNCPACLIGDYDEK